MIIGVPKEIKEEEHRVAVTPSGVSELKNSGHHILIERAAGEGSGFSDIEYENAGAVIIGKSELFNDADLILKVKEPLPSEYNFFRKGQALFTYLHLAPNPDLIDFLLSSRITGLAYETLEVEGRLPLLKPMSEIAGKMAPVVAAFFLQKVHGGEGVLMSGVEGATCAKVLILGAGNVGMSALKVAYGMGSEVAVINKGSLKLEQIDRLFEGRVKTLHSTDENIRVEVMKADVVIGAVLVTGAKAPKLISRELVSNMKKGAVIVDVAVDQGGCAETTRPTTHTDPVYTVDGVIHYAVANMPGAYPRTSTQALTNKTIEYVKILADMGIERAIEENAALKSALNTYQGRIIHKAVIHTK
ncbi:MAG: alanine dehydrogenase [Thermodesulfovibrionia bacterium]|nr:alanine dehydrogenase [Thermodesulfovibrionia bacterium]